MKVLIQWTRRHPADWEELSIRPNAIGNRVWRDLPRRPIPRGDEVIDDERGWIFDLNVQGVHFGGYDHISVQPIAVRGEEGIEVTAWVDDPEDVSPSARFASRWVFLPPAPDPDFGGRTNTRQTVIRYGGSASHFAHLPGTRPWGDFRPPANPLHGIWVPDELAQLHVERRTIRGWREWIE